MWSRWPCAVPLLLLRPVARASLLSYPRGMAILPQQRAPLGLSMCTSAGDGDESDVADDLPAAMPAERGGAPVESGTCCAL